jgi:thioesterase domain-containing protein
VGRRDSFFDVGGHSFLAVRLLAEIEREFGLRLPLSFLVHSPTVAALATALRDGAPPLSWQSVVPLQPFGSQPPFFVVHGIGGGVLCFRDLARHLGPDQPLFGLQAVTLGGAEREYDRIEEMAAHYVRELRSVQPEGPYALGGLSFGGIVALEMAHQLRDAGEAVAALVLLDCKGPGYPQFPAWQSRVAAHLRHFRALPNSERLEYLRVRAQSVYDLVRRRFLSENYQRHKEASLDRALRDIGIAHLHAAYEYQLRPYAGAVMLMRAEQQPIGCLPDPCNGWDQVVTGHLEIVPVPGDHASLLLEPHLRTLATRLTETLTRARS